MMPATPATLIHHFLERGAASSPDATAVVFEKERWTYAEIDRRANRLARELIGAGVRGGDRVVLISENRPEYVVAYYGILKTGGVSVALNPDLKPESLRSLLAELRPKSVLVSRRYGPLLGAAGAGGLGIDDIRVLAPGLPDLSISSSGMGEDPGIPIDPGACAMIVYTSGSSGRPKGVMLSHANIVANTGSIIAYLELGPADIQMVVLPFHYVMGQSLLNTHIAVGGRVVINNKFGYTAAVLAQMARERVTGFSGVPSTYAHLLFKSPLAKYRDRLPALRYCSQAGGHMSRQVKLELLRVLPPHTRLYVMYGATEASARLTYLPPESLRQKIDSVGLPIPGVTMRVLSGSGEILEPGQIGELVASGDNIMTGYYRDESATKKVLDRHGYHTGDLGYMDQDGFLYVTGRKDDQLKVGGHRVDPREVEDVIMESGRVVECIVFGIPDPLAGRRLAGLIVPVAGGPADGAEIVEFCRDKLPRFKVPEPLVAVEAIPKSSIGKPDRAESIGLFERILSRGGGAE